jgi:AcrR family transcriptional regulator
MTDTLQKPLRKGEQTRVSILDAALVMASRDGLEGLTIGTLAERMGMSKSGVFAHFGSREDLQIAVLKRYHEQFAQDVFIPSMSQPRGLPRLQSLFTRWVERVGREIASGCIYISGAVEYDDRPGPVRDQLIDMVAAWQQSLLRATQQAIDEGHVIAETDAAQLVFEMYGLVLALHHDARFIRSPGSVERARTGFTRLIASARS